MLRPERFLFNRVWYEDLDGKPEFEEFDAMFHRLSSDEKSELQHLLSRGARRDAAGLVGQATSSKVNRILPFYVPMPKDEEAKIWNEMKLRKISRASEKIEIPADELVEDAGLAEIV
jgi:hypothetical protein